MNAIIMRKITITTNYQALPDVGSPVSVCISAPPGNAGDVIFKGDDDSEVPWIPGEFHDLHSVDLTTIEVKGTADDVLTVIGGTW